MDKFYRLSLPTLFFLLLSISAFAQSRTVSGVLKDSSGEPLPGATITIKGTTQGTVTDIDGFYSINVEIDDVLVVSFVGMKTREFTVTYNNSVPSNGVEEKKPSYTSTYKPEIEPVVGLTAKPRPKLADFLADSTKRIAHKKGENVTVVGTSSPGYRVKMVSGRYRILGVSSASEIRYLSPKKAMEMFGERGKYGMNIIVMTPYKNKWSPPYYHQNRGSFTPVWNVNLQSSITLERANRLPELQNSFVQGRPIGGNLTWQGANENEVFSWGPLASQLEYDGSNYAYDPQGALVNAGTGNGTPANTFDATKLFRTGHTIENAIQISRSFSPVAEVGLGYANSNRNGILPNQKTQSHRLKLDGKLFLFKSRLEVYPEIQYKETELDLPLRGGNLSNIFQSILLSPPTFDAANRTKTKNAVGNVSAYLLPDGSPRSFAPQSFDNPFGLLSLLPDTEKRSNLQSAIRLKYYLSQKIRLKSALSYNLQEEEVRFGVLPNLATFSPGRLTERNERRDNYNANLLLESKRFEIDVFYLEATLKYQVNHQKRELNRQDAFDFSTLSDYGIASGNQIESFENTAERTSHEWFAQMELDWYSRVSLILNNNIYTSNTIEKADAWLPSAVLDIDVNDLLDVYTSNFYFRVNASYAESLKEADLFYDSWHFNTTRQSVGNAQNFYEQAEIVFQQGLAPTRNREYQFGASFRAWYRFNFSVQYFNKTTQNFILPVWKGTGYGLNNVGELRNRGIEVSLDYDHSLGEDWGMDYRLLFSRATPEITQLYNGESRIFIAGFESVSTNLVANQPYGVLVGNVYERNDEGKLIIGADGFPLVALEQAVVGNPNPDFTLNFIHQLKWKGWRLNTLWEWRKGGDVWNGTQQALDYYGKSAHTESARGITDYIFDGVLQNGTRNNMLVDFANPANDISENRWVRYGTDGPVEDYVQKSSLFRLQEVRLGYSFRINNDYAKSINFSLFAQNLFVITPYNGISPQTPLFGYSEGAGLDYFNMPNTRRFGFAFKVEI